ncbi:hypothetical protein EG328_006843 [Venturia inaequalis]|uniref:Uncharacterized protein n=1 Tax=Venturia inaequalis TaxID=5025 RepID=A0A8H3UH11_VENIN|nr:hypothetical protein EG328_006843 [Venturia inaequalis]
MLSSVEPMGETLKVRNLAMAGSGTKRHISPKLFAASAGDGRGFTGPNKVFLTTVEPRNSPEGTLTHLFAPSNPQNNPLNTVLQICTFLSWSPNKGSQPLRIYSTFVECFALHSFAPLFDTSIAVAVAVAVAAIVSARRISLSHSSPPNSLRITSSRHFDHPPPRPPTFLDTSIALTLTLTLCSPHALVCSALSLTLSFHNTL